MAAQVVSCRWVPAAKQSVTLTPSPPAPVLLPEERSELWRLHFFEADEAGLSHAEAVEWANLNTR
jgi:hypothetical protein